MTVDFLFSPDPVRAEAICFGRHDDPDACAVAMMRFARLKPEGKDWHFDLVLSERWRRRIYCTAEFSAFFRRRPGVMERPPGIQFTVEADARQSPGYRVGFVAGWLVRHERGDEEKWTREHLVEDLARA